MSAPLVDLVNRTVLCFGIAAAVYTVSVSVPEGDDASPPHVAASVVELGIIDAQGNFIESDVVPLAIGQEFGWRLHIDDRAEHRWREVMTAPAAPREWIGDDLTVAACGTQGITERTETPRGGVLSHGWAITEGDPAGPYSIQLFLDDELVETLRFVVR